jgi:hypothetical protein
MMPTRIWDSCKTFSATRHRDRVGLGEAITEWIAKHRDCEVVDREVVQSSDRDFHCLSIVLFYKSPNGVASTSASRV